jgi:transcriptional regulator with XRE-family HTH domain
MQKEFNQQRIEMGERIRKLRKRCDFCQESLAEAMDVSTMMISRIENGITKMDVEFLMRLSRVLEVPVNVILGLEDDKDWRFRYL